MSIKQQKKDEKPMHYVSEVKTPEPEKPFQGVVAEEIVESIPEEIPVVAEPKQETVQIKKDNMIVIDDATGESIPPISHEKITVDIPLADKNSFMYEEHHVPVEEPVKKLEPKYDYEEPFSFKEKEIRDGGKF